MERLAILDQLAEHDKTLVRVLVVGAIFVGTGREGDDLVILREGYLIFLCFSVCIDENIVL